LPRLSLFYLI